MALHGIAWRIEANPFTHILHAQSSCSDTTKENFIINTAADIIEKAAKYGGKPCAPKTVFPSPKNFIIHFSLIFKNQDDLVSFLGSLNSSN